MYLTAKIIPCLVPEGVNPFPEILLNANKLKWNDFFSPAFMSMPFYNSNKYYNTIFFSFSLYKLINLLTPTDLRGMFQINA